MKKRILAIGEAPPLAEAARFVRRSEFEMSRVPTAVAALSMARRIPFDLLLVVYPLADSELPELVRRLRAGGAPGSASPLLVLAGHTKLPELEPVGAAEGFEIVDLDAPPHVLAAAASRYLGPIRAAPRYALAVALNIEPEGGDGAGATRGCSVNISVSGVLVGAAQRPPVGSRLLMAFRPASGEPQLESLGQVIRHADLEREGVDGFAVAFIRPEPEAIDRLESFLAGLGQNPETPAAAP